MKTYVVGGAVRNILMGKPVNDMDYVVVGESVESMLAAGFKQVGADFPVFLHPVTGDEYALARTERKTGKGYHGFAVHADPNVTLTEDLRRRDITVNAMAVSVDDWALFQHWVQYDREVSPVLIDPFGGLMDVLNGLIRPVALPTFVEDPLRVVRAARFAATYDMTWTGTMYKAAAAVLESGELATIPMERFAIEVDKAISGCNTAGSVAKFVGKLAELGLVATVGTVLTRLGDYRTSLGAKLRQFAMGLELNDLATQFGLSNATIAQISMVRLVDHVATTCADSQVNPLRKASSLCGLVDTIRKSGAEVGMQFVEDVLTDPGVLSSDVAQSLWFNDKVKQMNGLYEEVRFATHVDPATPPRQIASTLQSIRIQKMSELL